MARETAENSPPGSEQTDQWFSDTDVSGEHGPATPTNQKQLSYQYRHGNRDAEVIDAQLLNAELQPVELIDSGCRVNLKMRFLFHRDVVQPVCGFMIRSRHGTNVYGTNTEQQGIELGTAKRGEVIEATFAFNCWLGQEHYFISVAVHSADGVAYDWLDGVIFFRVACEVEMEGLANLHATVTTSRVVAGQLVTAAG